MRKKTTRAERFEIDLKLIRNTYYEKSINQNQVFSIIHAIEQLMFCKTSEIETLKKLRELQDQNKDYHAELKTALSCNDLIESFKLECIKLIVAL
jgi:hypothetical protein